MLKLRYQEGWTLQEIGDLYGISRERVRQIIGNTGRVALNVRREYIQSQTDKSNEELASELGLREKSVGKYRGDTWHVAKGDSTTAMGVNAEKHVSLLLEKLGIKNELMPYGHEFDILTDNNVRIDVKVTASPRSSPSLSIVTPQYRFHVGDVKKKKDTDFFIFVISDSEDIFVVPSASIPDNQVEVMFCWPPKWNEYHNNFELIKDFK